MTTNALFPLSSETLNWDNNNDICSSIKTAIASFNQQLTHFFSLGTEVNDLLIARSNFIDHLLLALWEHLFQENREQISLIAVGGYGREELHPHSDIDLLVLTGEKLSEDAQHKIGQFLTWLWDSKLQVGHSVRSLTQCIEEATQDISVITNLMEARLIQGDEEHFNALQKALFSKKIWPIADYFNAKLDEQRHRHQSFHDTTYNLQPDLKNNPGGLRDIHILQWLALRLFHDNRFDSMVEHQFINSDEALELHACRDKLWQLRFALHLCTKRQDNRLLFEYQPQVATLLGFGDEGNVSVRQMMKMYFNVAQTVNELNMIFLELFKQRFVSPTKVSNIVPISNEFRRVNGEIDVIDESLFTSKPEQMLNLFYVLASQPAKTTITPRTQRLLRHARAQYDGTLSHLPEARKLFIAILQHPNAINGALVPMHKHNMLSLYLSEWNTINGLMQFDHFHSYTVDEHTIRLLQNLQRFANPTLREENPLCADLYPNLPRPDLLLMAALFHDIAKGLGGNHAIRGKEIVERVAILHGLPKQDRQLVCWLVEQHLLLSNTAQTRDLQDPDIITTFANAMPSPVHLEYLLCLTVADIRATNPTLWNNWRQTLLRELYFSTLQYWQYDTQNLPNKRDIARRNCRDALVLLEEYPIDKQQLTRFWRACRVDYFFRHNPAQLAWHAQNLLGKDLNQPHVLISDKNARGGSEIFIYAPDRPYLFAAVSNELSAKNLNILAAQIFTNRQGMAMDSFVVLQPDGKTISHDRYNNIQQSLLKTIVEPVYKHRTIKRIGQHKRTYRIQTKINFTTSSDNKKSYLHVITLDKSNLLAQISESFVEFELNLHSARITTVGERVEDIFILTNAENQPLTKQQQQRLSEQLKKICER